MIFQLFAMLIWASSLIAGKFSYSSFDPALMVQLRLAIAAVFCLPIFFKKYRKIPPHLIKNVWLSALFCFPVVFMLQFLGLSLTSASSAVTMLGTEPLIIVLIGWLFFKQGLKLLDVILGLVAFLGVALVMLGSEEGGDISLLGCLLVILGGIVFAFGFYISKQVMSEVKPVVFTNIMIVLGTLMCIPFTLLLTQSWQVNLNLEGVGGLLYLSIGCTWLAYILWNKGLKDTPANISSILLALEPVFGVILAIVLLDEKLEFITAVGVILVIGATLASVLLPVWWKKRKQARINLPEV
ncbi:hypothetical protein A4G18_06740 [Pasteurellaceae bacterium Pebbles2]|nr:hypothetical protein [Pasteurellaceae bacterium Pebbles2]